MRLSPLSLLRNLGIVVTSLGVLCLWPGLSDPGQWKAPLLALGLGLWACAISSPKRISLQIPLAAALFFLSLLWRQTHPQAPWSTGLTLACAFAFYLGWARVRLPGWALVGILWVSILYGIGDLLALWPAPIHHDALVSLFANRHAFAGLLLAGLFAHFFWLENEAYRFRFWAAPAKPGVALAASPGAEMPRRHRALWLGASTLMVILALLLTDSRSAQGSLFLLLLPMMFMAVRLDFEEPPPERLLWVAGATLLAGLVWLNLPDRQWRATAHTFTEDPVISMQEREVAWQAFLQAKWLGHGSGAYPWAAREQLPHFSQGGQQTDFADSAWNQLEPLFDQTQTQADLALSAAHPILANSHVLQVLAENGFVGLLLEGALLALALLALFRRALREGHVESRYAAFALLALILHGLFTPALESPPLRVLYFGLIGYGASAWPGKEFWREAFSPWQIASARLFVLALLTYGAFGIYGQVQSEKLFRQAVQLSENPRELTNAVVATLEQNPLHVEANYAYAQVLAGFRRQAEALARLDLLADFAPDPPRQDLARASVLAQTGSTKEATALLAPWLHRRHPPLPTLEFSADLYAATNECESLGRLIADSTRLRSAYPQPDAARFTVSVLQQEFLVGEEVNFLQRWFGGKALRRHFMERRLASYQQALDARSRLEAVLRLGCGDKGSPRAPRRTWHRIRQG